MPYKVLAGVLNASLAVMQDVNPQPRSEGIKPTRRTYAADGSVYDEGKYVELLFDVINNPAAYLVLLTQFGLHDSLTNTVTVYVPDDTFAFVRMNGVAVRPDPGEAVRRGSFFIREVVIVVKDLEDVT